MDRKEIALKLRMSVYQVRKNEEALGLDQAKVTINKRVIRYNRPKAMLILQSRGLV
jgi:hypothetical protein